MFFFNWGTQLKKPQNLRDLRVLCGEKNNKTFYHETHKKHEERLISQKIKPFRVAKSEFMPPGIVPFEIEP